MTHQGLRALFERALIIDEQKVIDSILPIWSLIWIVRSWAAGLNGSARDNFLSTKLGELLENPESYLDRDWVRALSPDKNFELASATILFAHKKHS
jgi:hypothetical protein